MITSTTVLRRRRILFALASAAMPVSLCSTASADRYWLNGLTVGNWSNGSDWSATSPTGAAGAGSPGVNDNVCIANTDALNEAISPAIPTRT